MIAETLQELVAPIGNGASIALPPTRSGPAMAATRALIEKGAKNLHLIAIPTSGLQADLLIGAGCVATMESAGVTLDEFGQAPRFVDAVKQGALKLKDTTCPALVSALQAGEKGIPFIPMRGLIGSDLLKHREDYQVIDYLENLSGDQNEAFYSLLEEEDSQVEDHGGRSCPTGEEAEQLLYHHSYF